MKRFACTAYILVFLGVAAGRAAQPSHEAFAADVFMLRNSVTGDTAAAQGVWRFDPVRNSYSRMQTLFAGGRALGATEDSILFQGADVLEFDLSTMRLLRRYSSLPAGSGNWTFQGTVVAASAAARLGVEPGIYGYPVCPPTAGVAPICTAQIQPPGYPARTGNQTLPEFLYRRDLEPGATSLTLVKTFPSMKDGATIQRRHLTFDPTRQHFWTWTEGVSANFEVLVSALNRLSIGASGVGNEQTVAVFSVDVVRDPSEKFRLSDAFGFDPSRGALLQTFDYDHQGFNDVRFTRLSPDAATEEVLLRNPAPVPTAFAVVPPSLPALYTQVIPAIGETAGANGTFWRSDLWLYNPSDTPMDLTLRRVARPDMSRTVTLPAHGSERIENVLRELGGGAAGDGVGIDALVVTSPYRWGAQLSASSRTYTVSSSGGTYGQSVPAVPGTTGYSMHENDFIYLPEEIALSTNAGFMLDKRNPLQFRHNVGIVNDAGEPLTVRLRYGTLFNGPIDPSLGIEQRVVVAPHSVSVVPIETLFPPSIINERPPRIWVSADRPAPIWMSMVDNITGDATFVPFELFTFRAAVDDRLVVPQVASTAGANGTFWRTDLYGYFPIVDPIENEQQPLAFLHGSCEATTRLTGVSGAPDNVDFGSFWISIFPDVARQFGACPGDATSGALALRIGAWTAGFTRTYTTREDGGTYGEMLPFFPAGGLPVQHFAGIEVSPRQRINAGLFNPLTDRDASYRLLLFDQSGKMTADATITVAPNQTRQDSLSSLLGRPIADGTYGLTVSPVDFPDLPGRSWAYVSLVDNVSGDPTNWW